MSRAHVTAKVIVELERSLTPRERLVLATVDRLRLATGVQLERLHFSDVTKRQARQVLARMTDRRLLRRLPRVIGGARAGSAGFVYTLDVAGMRLRHPHGRRARSWDIGLTFVAHGLAVAELFVRLVEAERASRLHLASFVAEPACWRSFAGPGGARVVLKPDAYLSLQLDGFEDCWFVEVDRSTEAVPTVARKCDTYRRYWQSGAEQARSGVFPRVLWLVPDDHRHETLIDVVGRQPAEAWPLFAVAVYDDAVERVIRGAHR